MAGRYWKEAATLILVGRSHEVITNINSQKNGVLNHDYKILSLTRSSGSPFLPNAVVFPGGKLDKADLDPKWINLFKEKGYTHNDLLKIFRFASNNNIEMYTNKGDEALLPELAFRICAIRETFEETGLLLAEKDPVDSFASVLSLEGEETEKWRKLVVNEPSEFVKLFAHIGALPSARHLYEWSAWLTPTSYGGMDNRFDTAFYVAFIDKQIHVSKYDQREIQDFKISGPMDILNSYYKKELLLSPPQLYELSRLVRYSELEALKDFSEKRSGKGLVRFLPVREKCTDGAAVLFSGDDNYPEAPDYFEDKKLQRNQKVEEYRKSCHTLHRVEFRKGELVKLFAKNIYPDKGHIIPVSFDNLILTT